VENAEEVSRDRKKWKDIVVAAMDLNGLRYLRRRRRILTNANGCSEPSDWHHNISHCTFICDGLSVH